MARKRLSKWNAHYYLRKSFLKNLQKHIKQQKALLFSFFAVATALVLVLSSTFFRPAFVLTVFAANPGDVVINEFVSDGPQEWVELLNTSGSDISLSGFKLSELTTPQEIPTEVLLLNLSGTIPAHGILVFNVSGLNNDGDSIALYNGEISPENLWQKVTYGEVTGYPATTGLAIEPEAGQSAYLLALPSTWAIAGTTPTKGWFNVAQEFDCITPSLFPPTLISVANCLNAAGINSNIGKLDNPSATPDTENEENDSGALYFSNDEGKIVFEQTLNLTDKATVDILHELGEAMDMSEGFVSFDSETAEAMAAVGAKIYMYGLDELGFTSEPHLIVKDDNGNVIDPEDENYPTIVSDYDDEEGILRFTTNHFTQFEVEMGSISGYKWNDLNGNGMRNWNDEDGNDEKDDGEEYTEPGLPGWTIVLSDESGDETEAITDATGAYSFTDLEDGNYTVCEENQLGWTQTFPNPDEEDECYEINIEGDSQTNVDFGNAQNGHIVVRKVIYPEPENGQEFDFIIDVDDDGDGEIGEIDEFSLPDSETGDWEQTFDVAPGTYTINETVPEGWRLENIACEYDGDSVGESAPPSGETVTVDAGDTVTCTFTNIGADQTIITGHKWEDTNGNGEQDERELALKNWKIALGSVGQKPQSQEPAGPENQIPIEIVALSLTGANGWYYLPVSQPGNYKVFEEKRDGWATTNPAPLINSFFDIEYRIDSETRPQLVEDSFFDVSVREPIVDPFESPFSQGQTIAHDNNHKPLDFGNFELVDITGLKWNDQNGDGTREGERGLGDVIIALGRQNGEPRQKDGHEVIPIEIIAMNLTSNLGGFIIPNVGPGRYKLFEEKKSGWSATNPAPRLDSFFDITYDLDSISKGDPDFDLLRVTGDPDFDLLRDSFFDVFVELSGQDMNQSEATGGDEATIPSVPLEFGNHKLLILSEEAATEAKETSTVIAWTTDFPGTSRVIYDTVSHLALGSAPNYGYAFSTDTFDTNPKATSHSVTVAGLTSGTTYFYRSISSASPESVGGENSFTTVASSDNGSGGEGGTGGGGGGTSSGGLIGGSGGVIIGNSSDGSGNGAGGDSTSGGSTSGVSTGGNSAVVTGFSAPTIVSEPAAIIALAPIQNSQPIFETDSELAQEQENIIVISENKTSNLVRKETSRQDFLLASLFNVLSFGNNGWRFLFSLIILFLTAAYLIYLLVKRYKPE